MPVILRTVEEMPTNQNGRPDACAIYSQRRLVPNSVTLGPPPRLNATPGGLSTCYTTRWDDLLLVREPVIAQH